MIAVGVTLVTVGGYLAKDGWEELKKQPLESNKASDSQDTSVANIYVLLKTELEKHSKKASSKAVLSYVQVIASDANAIANIWSKILEDLEQGIAFKDKSYLYELEIKYGYNKEPNAPYFYRLEQFYDLLTKVPQNSLDSTWIHQLSESLDKLKYARPAMLEAMRSIAIGQEEAGQSDDLEELKKLNNSVILLHQEAAKINTLVYELRLYTETEISDK